MAITYNQLRTNLTSPDLANFSIQDQYLYRVEQLNEFEQSPEYIFMSPTDKQLFRKNVMTNSFIGFGAEELERKGNVRGADYARQIEAVRTGQVVPLDVLDGFIDTFKNSLSGKIGIGVGQMVSSGSLSEHIYDDDVAKQLREVRDQAFDFFEVQGTTDYRIGKGLGIASGIALDIAGTAALYGSVGAPGLLTKAIGGSGARKLLAKSSEYTAKQLATKLTPYWFGQMAVETVGFQVEEAVADTVTGKMDADGGFQSWLKTNFKSNLARGFAYFLAGEAIGAGLGSMMKMYGKTFTGKGFRDQTVQKIHNMGPDDSIDYLMNTITSMGRDGKLNEDVATAFRSIDPELEKKFQKLQRELDFQKTLEKPESQFSYSMSRHFDADVEVKENGEHVLNSLKGVDQNKTFKDRNDFLKYLSKEDKVIRNQLFDNSFNVYKEKSGSFSIRYAGKGKVQNTTGSMQAVVRTLAPADFRVREDAVKNFVDVAVPKDSLVDYKVKLSDDFFVNKPKPTKGVIYGPTKIDNVQKQNDYIRSLKEQFKENFDFQAINTRDLTNYLENIGTYNKYSIDWMETVLGKGQAVQRGGKILVSNPDGTVKEFESMTDAGRYVHSLIIDETLLSKHLANEFRYKTKVNDDGSLTVTSRTSKGQEEIIAEGYSVQDLLSRNAQLLPSKPIETSPNWIEFTNGNLNFTDKVGYGSFKKVTDMLKQYKSNKFLDEKNVLKKSNFTMKFNDVTEDYVVKLPNGLEREFSSKAEAIKWADQDWDSVRTRIEDLEQFGYKVRADEAGYTVYDFSGNKYSLRDRDSLLDFIDNNQSIKNADPIDGMGQETSRIMGKSLGDQVDSLRGSVLKRGATQKGRAAKSTLAQKYLSELLEPIKKSVERYGYKEVDDLMNSYLSANKLFEQKDTATKGWISSLFKGFDTFEKESLGKLLSEEQAITLENIGGKLAKYGLEDDPKYFQLITQVRTYFDRFGRIAGVPEGDYLTNYLPRFLQVDYADLIKNQADEKYLYKKYFKGKVPANMDPFMRKMRKKDYLSMQETNLQDIMNSYSEISWRSQYLEEFDEKLGFQIEKLQNEKANPDLLLQLKTFKERMVGRVYDEDAINAARRHENNRINAEKILSNKTLKKVLSEQRRTNIAGWARKSNPVSGAKALMTSALMSFKMRMPVRNMAQIWTHLGAIYDNPEILRAFKMASDNPEQLYKEMLEKGIVNTRQGRNSGQLLSFIRNSNQVGLDWHQNSDDFDRIIGYVAAKNRFSAAYNGLKTGKYDLKQFHNVAGSWALDDVDKIKIGDFLKTGQLAEAETVLQRAVVEKCFFDYSSASKPVGQNKSVASLFMQYSTFPLQTAQLWKNSFYKSLREGNSKQALASMARVSANIAGLSVLFSELIGYSNTPISFFNYMMFTGGPVAGSVADSVSILGSQSTLGQKTEQLWKANAPSYTPYYGAGKAIKKSVMALTEGEELMALKYLLGGSGRDQDSVLDVGDQFTI